jgi:hypothetical protein
LNGGSVHVARKPNFRVGYHRIVEKQLQLCIDALVAAGWEKTELTQRLANAERRLREDPSSCGEPVFKLRPLGVVVSVFCVRPFTIHFALDEKSRSVLIRKISLLALDGK